jgi:S-adenosyl-L-methionine hydrolase (adenosine-forming)
VPEPKIVTFTTDFGIQDHYVAAMKGVVLSINPQATLVDVSHSVQAFDVLDGALTITEAYNYFPSGTIHVVVVDPGVGTARRPILVSTEKQLFVAPDNGVLSMIYEREPRLSVRHITSEHYFLQPVSAPFHGRDIFARVGGYLSKGVETQKFGEPITDFVRFAAPRPKAVNERMMRGVVLKVDKFGNIVTNFRAEDVPALFGGDAPAFKIMVGPHEVTKIHTAYAQGAPGEVFAIVGSMGFLEIAANRASAAETLNVQKGTDVGVLMESAKVNSAGSH